MEIRLDDMGAFHFSWANASKVLKDDELDANQPSGRSFFNSFETHPDSVHAKVVRNSRPFDCATGAF
jgi:hypothetical protein